MILGARTIGTVAYMGGVMSLPEPFVWSWSQMLEYHADYMLQPGERIFYDRATVSYHAFARNALVQRMRGDWIVMLDTDQQFEPDLVMRLYLLAEKHQLDVLSGLYQYRAHPHNPLLYSWGKGEEFHLIGDWDRAAEVFQVGAAGGGCLFVRRSVFQRIERELHEPPFAIWHDYSEDLSFFKRLQRLKMPAYCAPRVMAGHLQYHALALEDYNPASLPLGPRETVEGFQ